MKKVPDPATREHPTDISEYSQIDEPASSLKPQEPYRPARKRTEPHNLLILDNLEQHPSDSQSRLARLDIIEDRPQKKSSIILSRIPVKKWHDIIGEKTIADAVPDRNSTSRTAH